MNVLRIEQHELTDAIHRAFVESRFSLPHGARYVNIHADGSLVVSRSGLSVRQSGGSIIALECLGSPEFPGNQVPMGGTWGQEEYRQWMLSRPDLYLAPTLDGLWHQAKRLGLQLDLVGVEGDRHA